MLPGRIHKALSGPWGPSGASVCAVLIAAQLLSACRAESPDYGHYDASIPADSGVSLAVSPPRDCPAVDNRAVILEVSAPAETSSRSQPIRGRAAGAVDVFARVGGGTSSLGSIGTSGTFCVPVDLYPDSQNVIELVPRTADGCWGQARTVSIRHWSAEIQPNAEPLPLNVAVNRAVDSSPDLSGGYELTAINDGEPGTWTELSLWDAFGSRYAWVRVNLGGLHTISRIEIQWTPGESNTEWAKKYKVMLSAENDPGTPDPEAVPSSWTTVVQEDDAAWGTQQKIVSPTNARWAALLLYLDAVQGLEERFRIAEFGVYAMQPAAAVGAQDSCP